MDPPSTALKARPPIDREAGSALDRPATFFQDSDYALPSPSRWQERRDRGALVLLGIGLVLGTGFVGLIELTPLVRRLIG